MLKRLKIVILCLVCIVPMVLCGHTVFGYVIDEASGERLIGATVLDTISKQGAVTNNSGYFSLTLKQENVALQVSYVGYQPSEIYALPLAKDTLLTFGLHENTRLEEVVVVGHQSISGPQTSQMSAIEVPVTQIKGIPALAGEVDIIKALQLLPGVQSGTEGSAGLYVRGGGPDENLILLDGVPLYSVNHMMGFFSVFNADAVKNVTLYKGDFPARFGSRLSSIVDVRQNDGNTNGYHGNVTIGLLSAKVNAEGPIPNGTKDQTTTFNISARRTYFDLFSTPIMAAISASESKGREHLTAGYHFTDVNAKLTHTFSDKDKLSGSFYFGDDVVNVNMKEQERGSYLVKNKLNWDWGNILGAVNWEHRYNAKIFSNIQLSFTRYRYYLNITSLEEDINNHESYEFTMQYRSRIMDAMAQANFEYRPNTRHEIRFGGNYTYHNFKPEVGRMMINAQAMGESAAMDTVFSNDMIHAHEGNIYFEDNYSPCKWLKFNLGLHGSLYSVKGKTYPSIEPRVGFRALIINDLAFKASYSYMSQYIHLLSNSSVSLPTDLWVPVTTKIPPMRSMQAAAGLSYNLLDQVELSVEGYYKYMKNVLEYKDGASYLSNIGWEEQVCVGNGWSYGVEFLAQRKFGQVTGWIGYTWSRTMRQFDKEGQMINYGNPFHAKYDREHDLSVTVMWQINEKWDISGTFIYGTGSRGTFGTQAYYDPNYTRWNDIEWSRVNYVSERNNYKMPDYHRLDLGANCHIPHKKWAECEHIVTMAIYNVYSHKNPFLVYVSGNSLYQISIFPIIPSVSYTFKF